jgi:hypothetical protein
MKQIFLLENGILIYLAFAAIADEKKYKRLNLFYRQLLKYLYKQSDFKILLEKTLQTRKSYVYKNILIMKTGIRFFLIFISFEQKHD